MTDTAMSIKLGTINASLYDRAKVIRCKLHSLVVVHLPMTDTVVYTMSVPVAGYCHRPISGFFGTVLRKVNCG
jgi:hypothetical protein